MLTNTITIGLENSRAFIRDIAQPQHLIDIHFCVTYCLAVFDRLFRVTCLCETATATPQMSCPYSTNSDGNSPMPSTRACYQYLVYRGKLTFGGLTGG